LAHEEARGALTIIVKHVSHILMVSDSYVLLGVHHNAVVVANLLRVPVIFDLQSYIVILAIFVLIKSIPVGLKFWFVFLNVYQLVILEYLYVDCWKRFGLVRIASLRDHIDEVRFNGYVDDTVSLRNVEVESAFDLLVFVEHQLQGVVYIHIVP
jgi:hypothetical protein